MFQITNPDGAALTLRWSPIPGQLQEINNEEGDKCLYEYSSAGELICEVGFDGITREYEYDSAGRCVNAGVRGSPKTVFTYDNLDRLIQAKLPDGSIASYEFDKSGGLIEAVNDDATVSFVRDLAGRVIEERRGEYVVSSAYDDLGQRTSVQVHEGIKIGFEYDRRGLPVQLTAEEPESSEPWTTSIRRDYAGRPVLQRFPGGAEQLWEYSRSGLLSFERIRQSSQVVHGVSYEWRRKGLLEAISYSEEGLTRFEYDRQDRPQCLRPHTGARQFRRVDFAGNLYSTEDQRERVYLPGGVLQRMGDTSYSYGAQGQCIEKVTLSQQRWVFEWSAGLALRAVTTPDGQRIEFAYDALGRRIRKRTAVETIEYVWDGEDMIGERPEGGQPVWWASIPNAFLPTFRCTKGNCHYLVRNLTSPYVFLLECNGELIWKGEMDLYGLSDKSAKNALVPWRWPGQYEDSETGLYYNRFRYYSPQEGRYINQDPLGIFAGIRPYEHVDNPLQQCDPLGLIIVYHYTDKDGFNSISSNSKEWDFRAASPEVATQRVCM